jgi:hypothetical protein
VFFLFLIVHPFVMYCIVCCIIVFVGSTHWLLYTYAVVIERYKILTVVYLSHVVLVLWWLICFDVSVTSPEDRNRQLPQHCVVLCVVTMEKVLINIIDRTC